MVIDLSIGIEDNLFLLLCLGLNTHTTDTTNTH